MNIKEAKEEIKRSVEIYLDKNELGEYTIPVSQQRPIFMTGAPGIGKTAIIQQIASELDIALVSCSMSHHTRHSALGRPIIEEKDYGGKRVSATRYTMSEIITAIYHVMRDSGKKEGILFLDEINCVSEVLAPAILLFLQYKTFGNQSVPEGWVVVTAGNPPQYNKSAKEFDVAILDRLKRIDVTEDFSVWKQYAYQKGVHAAVITFLEMNQQCFYSVRLAAEGTEYVTARGWEDLSAAMQLYEKKEFPVDMRLIGQYITDTEIARKFESYYELYREYKSVYHIENILAGKYSREMVERFKRAQMDESFSLRGLLLERLNEGFRKAVSRGNSLQIVTKALCYIKEMVQDNKILISILLEEQAGILNQQLQERIAANNMTDREKEEYLIAIHMLSEYKNDLEEEDPQEDFRKVKVQFNREVEQHEKQVKEVQLMRDAVLAFIKETWGDNQELLFYDQDEKLTGEAKKLLEI